MSCVGKTLSTTPCVPPASGIYPAWVSIPAGNAACPSTSHRRRHCAGTANSAFAYAKPVSQLVSKLKFRGQIQLARLFGELLADHIGCIGSPAQAVLPVPLHPRRLRSRGFNQALEIARPLSRALSLPMLTDTVHRHRDTQPQAEQSARQRERNIRGAFVPGKPVAYQCVAIVDDVMTSGHTVSEIAKLLRQAGVGQIEVWCVARAWPHK